MLDIFEAKVYNVYQILQKETNDMSVEMYTLYLTHLCKCAIENSISSPPPENLDFSIFYSFCQEHRLTNIAYAALKYSEVDISVIPEMIIFKDKYEQAVLNDAAQHYYLDQIKEAFAKNKIDYAILKGAVLKDIYPSSDFRQSSDMDIFIKYSDTYKAKAVMVQLGFENMSFGNNDTTDNYCADKFSYIELHKKLIPQRYKWAEECNKITDRLVYKGNHEYVMSDEDFYIFMIAHIAKHLSWSSVGIRSILDVWMYLKADKNLDWNFINEVLKKCDLTLLHSKLMDLVDYWFNGKTPEDDIQFLSNYIASSGWNGREIQIKAFDVNALGSVNRSGIYVKIKAFFKIAFMDIDTLKTRYPILEKYSILLPLCWIHRGISVVFKRRESIRSFMHLYDKINMDEVRKIDSFRKKLGL